MAREVISHLGVCVPGSNRGLSEYMYISFFFLREGGGGRGEAVHRLGDLAVLSKHRTSNNLKKCIYPVLNALSCNCRRDLANNFQGCFYHAMKTTITYSVLQMTQQGSILCTHNSMVEKSCFMYQHFCPGHPIIVNRYALT